MIKVINRSPARDLRPHAVEAVEPSIMARATVLRLMRLPRPPSMSIGAMKMQRFQILHPVGAPTSTGTYNVLQVHACTGTGMLGWRVVWAPGTWELELGDDNKDDKAAE